MKIYLVGGAVRDQLLGLPVKERDWLVEGATEDEMLALGYRRVGKEFPVFLHPKTNEEYALARKERKIEAGYKGFTFDTSTEVQIADDLRRRDLTINAMARTSENELIDPYQGQKDLQNKLLHHVSDAFSEDPVRILRVARFLARYAQMGFRVAPDTMTLMQQMVKAGEVNALVAERVWKEFERALGEANPEMFFQVLADCGALEILFPYLSTDPIGIQALQTAAKLQLSKVQRFAALCHNLDKPMINTLCERYRSPNYYRELALLTVTHYQRACDATALNNPSSLLKLFNALDIFRRYPRFIDFIRACEAIAQTRALPFKATWLEKAAEITKSFDVHELLKLKLTGEELAQRLKEKRCERLTNWLTDNSL